jgi:hypothetical protein
MPGAREDRGSWGDRKGRPSCRKRARGRGHEVVAMSRSNEVDVITGEGLAAGLATGPESAPGSAGAPIPEIAGPREENLAEMAVLLTARRGDPVKIEGVTDPAWQPPPSSPTPRRPSTGTWPAAVSPRGPPASCH